VLLNTWTPEDGFVVDEEWFNERNKRLEISDDEQHDHLLLPSTFFAELMLSYVLSSAGYVKIDYHTFNAQTASDKDFYVVSCVFLGKDLQRGWFEDFIVLQQKLRH